jgi:EmrB/QacA subfamily drug resistance transporter
MPSLLKPASSPANPVPSTASVRQTALAVCLVSGFINPFTGACLNIALPTMAKELNLDAVTVPWVLTIFMLASSIFLLPMGRLADIYGRKKLFAIGWSLFSVTSLLVSFSVNGPMLLTLRVFQGISAAMFFGAAVAILTSVYPREERGRVLGMSTAAQYAGFSLGPVLGGVLTQYFGWRSIYLTMVPLALLMAGVTATRLKGEWADAQGEKFDTAGSVIYGLSLALILYGVSLLPNISALGPIAAGVVVLAIFGWWEGRVQSPVLNVGLFKGNRIFALANLAALINFSASSSIAFLLSLYLQNVKGFTPQTAGLIMIAQPIVQALLSAPAGQMADRMNASRLSAVGMGVTAIGLFLFSRLGMQTPVWAVILILMLVGVGVALFGSPNTSVVMNAVDKRYYGVASAVVTTMRLIGSMFSSGMAATIFAVYIGRVAITPGVAPLLMTSINVAFTLFCGLCVAGIFAALAGGQVWERVAAPGDVETSSASLSGGAVEWVPPPQPR